jgi:hypothetical protein
MSTEDEAQGQAANERASHIKALDITIDSLKQYITLSTVSIGGLLAYYNSSGNGGSPVLFITSVAAFVICTIVSVFTINTFINKVNTNIIDITARLHRFPNFIAISSFFIGLVCGALFFLLQVTASPPPARKVIKATIQVHQDTLKNKKSKTGS